MFQQQYLNCIKKTQTTHNTKYICTCVSVQIKQKFIEREKNLFFSRGMFTFLMDDYLSLLRNCAPLSCRIVFYLSHI